METTATKRDEFVKTLKGEREYYHSKGTSLKEPVKLPITVDGCEAMLEMVTKALEIPLDDVTRQIFAGYVHHLGQTENSTTFGEVGKVLYKNLANHATWVMDQESKKRQDEEAKKWAAAKMKETEGTVTPITAAKDVNATGEGQTIA